MSPPVPITWVVFDLGETLVDETRAWGGWADYLDIPRLTFFAALGAVIAQRRPHTDVFELLRPGFDFEIERAAKAAAGSPWQPELEDLYPDALPTLGRLRSLGYHLAVMANQPLASTPLLASLPVDRFGTSAEWGVLKPDPAFFERVASEVGAPASKIAYVGDRVDNDVLPAKAAGMLAVHLRRGPWGVAHGEWPEAAAADLTLESLADLPDALSVAPVIGGWQKTENTL